MTFAADLSANPALRFGVAAAVVIGAYAVAKLLARLARPKLTESQTPSFGRVVPKLGVWLLTGAGVVVGVTIAFPSVKPVDFIAGLGIFSIALGFAFQDILSNLLAGLLLIIRQPFEQGDQIEVNGHLGTVEGITIRETTLRTFDGTRVVIPNADVYQSALHVKTAFEQRRTSLAVGVGYDADLDRTEQAILEAARATDGVAEEPAPQAYLIELGDSAVVFDLRYWTEAEQATVRRVQHEVLKSVKQRLDRDGIDIPFPIRTLEAAPSLVSALRANSSNSGTHDGERSSSIDLDELTRDELYARARDEDIAGRSNMTREELASALDG